MFGVQFCVLVCVLSRVVSSVIIVGLFTRVNPPSGWIVPAQNCARSGHINREVDAEVVVVQYR